MDTGAGDLGKPSFDSSDHYKFFYTEFFGLTDRDYEQKRLLDIGCGPRGSLEWASMASERIGIDSLVAKYRKAFNIDRHSMTYIDAPAEKIPFEDGHFDFVMSFNSLDHVDDLDRAVAEIARVTKAGSTFLLICEVNHPPTETEPLCITEPHLRQLFAPTFRIDSWRSFLTPPDHDIYRALKTQEPLSETEDEQTPQIIAAEMARRVTY